MGHEVKLTLLSVFSLQLCLKKLLTSLSTIAVCSGVEHSSYVVPGREAGIYMTCLASRADII